MLGECRRVFANRARTPRIGSRSTTASQPKRCIHPPPFADRLARAAPTATMCCLSGDSSRSNGPTWPCAQCSHVDRADTAGDGRRGHAAAANRRACRIARRRRSHRALRDRWMSECSSTCTKARSPSSTSPFDEDYGYVTLESFLSHKPVITTTDAGGPLEFVRARDKRAGLRADRRGRGRRDESPCGRQGTGRAAWRRRLRTRAARHMGWRHRETGQSRVQSPESKSPSLDEEADHPDSVPERGRHAAVDAARSSSHDRGYRHDRSPRHRRWLDRCDGGGRPGRGRGAHHLAPQQARSCDGVYHRHRRRAQARRRFHRQHRRRQSIRGR